MGGKLQLLWRENWMTLLVLAGIVTAFIVLRSQPTAIGSSQEFMASLKQGQPTIVEFYSNT
jgi:preprotein translocase subunit YajC